MNEIFIFKTLGALFIRFQFFITHLVLLHHFRLQFCYRLNIILNVSLFNVHSFLFLHNKHSVTHFVKITVLVSIIFMRTRTELMWIVIYVICGSIFEFFTISCHLSVNFYWIFSESEQTTKKKQEHQNLGAERD